ncbi:MAG: hypothetical protein LBU32_26290 [Clostridiales bacterium]|jgi:hypothetical protein|nr:hypothetical protein [Clostridiales bacterium]
MTLLEYYPAISNAYPEYVTQQQMCAICGVCKSTVYQAEKRGEVLYEKIIVGHVHMHKIRLTDALAFKYKREYGYRDDDEYIPYLRRFYERRLKACPDVLSALDVSEITGFEADSVQRWVGKGYLKAFIKGRGRGFRIPKEVLTEFLVSPAYNSIQDKSEKQIATLKEFAAWYAARIGGMKL